MSSICSYVCLSMFAPILGARFAAYAIACVLAGVLIGRLTASGGMTRRARPTKARRPARDGKEKRVEVYVGNLAYDVQDNDLVDLFKSQGSVGRVRIIKNRANGRSKGYGFVEMRTAKNVDTAIKELNGSDLKGRKLIVNEAKSRSRAGK